MHVCVCLSVSLSFVLLIYIYIFFFLNPKENYFDFLRSKSCEGVMRKK